MNFVEFLNFQIKSIQKSKPQSCVTEAVEGNSDMHDFFETKYLQFIFSIYYFESLNNYYNYNFFLKIFEAQDYFYLQEMTQTSKVS